MVTFFKGCVIHGFFKFNFSSTFGRSSAIGFRPVARQTQVANMIQSSRESRGKRSDTPLGQPLTHISRLDPGQQGRAKPSSATLAKGTPDATGGGGQIHPLETYISRFEHFKPKLGYLYAKKNKKPQKQIQSLLTACVILIA